MEMKTMLEHKWQPTRVQIPVAQSYLAFKVDYNSCSLTLTYDSRFAKIALWNEAQVLGKLCSKLIRKYEDQFSYCFHLLHNCALIFTDMSLQ